MNDTFSLKRFGLLAKKAIKEYRYAYLIYAVSGFGILFVIYGITVLNSLHERFAPEWQLMTFILGLILGSCLFSASFYAFFHNKAKGIHFLTIPASTLEKVLLSYVITQIIFFLVYFLLFSALDHVMCFCYNHFHKIPEYIISDDLHYYVANPLSFKDETVKGSILAALVMSAVSHFGSLRFEKNAFVKTALFMLIGATAVVYFNNHILKIMIPEESMPGGTFFNDKVGIGTGSLGRGFVFLPEKWKTGMYWFLPGMSYILFWVGSYYKLKEKQV